MYKKVLYKKAYRMLENLTPLKYDCGLLCQSKCCSGDSNAGMCLFPGEEIMFEKNNDFLTIRKEKLAGTDVLFAVCNGTCKRKFRPLSCRIYPYVPHLDKSGMLTIIEDPRAKYQCPLLIKSLEFKFDKMFQRNLYRTFQFLIQDSDIRDFLHVFSGVLDEYRRFVGDA